ncbi:MAG TPA: hypothetical protein VJ867_15125 [Gemmatimonadaceae bacterium]|nr:hypothetical protein [Gemmatimonadaceae bacterium]
MRVVPEVIDWAWIQTLNDEDLLDVERRVHAKFVVLERREKKALGAKYELCRGSAELFKAWDRWGRLANATRERSLRPIRRVQAAVEVEE